MDNFVIGNAVLNVGLIGGSFGISGFLFKRWMDQVEDRQKKASEKTEKTEDLLFEKIDRIFLELKTANGRTAKVEARVEAHQAVCDERNRGRRITDPPCGEHIG
jgi:23S rRNA G2445 N2-methylase RlmL